MRVVRVEVDKVTSYGVLEKENICLWTDAPWLGGQSTQTIIPLTQTRLRAPCNPSKIIGVAINFPGATGLATDFKEPLVFLKPSTSVIGPNDIIVSPFLNTYVWGESELAIVIGNRLSHASKDEVLNGIFGFTIGNDVSADNIQGWDHHLARSKSADTFCALGPWIDTDFDPSEKLIKGYHNNKLLREGRADDRLWAEPNLLVWLSSWMTLEPGDVILTGAPTRVRERVYFQQGDSYTYTIDGLGELINVYESKYEH